MKGVINIKDIRLYAFHGCLEEEAKIGGNYIVDVKIYTDYLMQLQRMTCLLPLITLPFLK